MDDEERPYTFDEGLAVDQNWTSHYTDTFQGEQGGAAVVDVTGLSRLPKKERAIKAPVAGVQSSPFETSYQDKVRWHNKSRVTAQKEYFGSTMTLAHQYENNANKPRFERTSDLIGSNVSPQKGYDTRPRSAANSFAAQSQYGSRPGSRAGSARSQMLPPSEVDPNTRRNAWNRNASHVGEVVFHNPNVAAKTLKYNGIPKYTPKTKHEVMKNRQHFTTMKADVDEQVVSTAFKYGMYAGEDEGGLGYAAKGKKRDDTTVSGDAPAWFQIPGVTVNKLNSLQLYTLLSWKAPIPRKHTDDYLLNVFGVIPNHEVDPNSAHHPDLVTHDAAGPGMAGRPPSAAMHSRPPTNHGMYHKSGVPRPMSNSMPQLPKVRSDLGMDVRGSQMRPSSRASSRAGSRVF